MKKLRKFAMKNDASCKRFFNISIVDLIDWNKGFDRNKLSDHLKCLDEYLDQYVSKHLGIDAYKFLKFMEKEGKL